MAYPQPAASDDVTQGQNFWRLNTPLTSSGDIYEADTGLLGISLGPNSDIANAVVTYVDPEGIIVNDSDIGQTVETGVGTVILSPDRSFIGRLDAAMDQKYPVSNRLGRVLVSATDVFDNQYRPQILGAFDNAQDTIEFIRPYLDVVGYFNAPPSLIPQRSDKVFRFKNIRNSPGIQRWRYIVIPYYGRKYANIQMMNYNGANVQFAVFGNTYTNNYTGATLAQVLEKSILASAAVASGAGATAVVRAAVDGMFDALVLAYDFTTANATGPVPTIVTMSDDPL